MSTQDLANFTPTGSVSTILGRICSYARIIEAGQRGYGYTAADMPVYANLLVTELDK